MALDKKAAFYTLGCKVNQYETESIKKQFLDRGYLETEFDSAADVYVINSCTVTNLADRKTRNMLRRAKSLNPESIVVATGCYAQTNAEDIAKISEVDYIIGNSDKIKIAEIVDTKKSEKISVGNIFEENRYQEYEFTTLREMSRAYIKIQDGCDNFCSYCKIPFARGKKRSRNPENILQEVKKLVQEGYKEVILIGINLGAYGEEFEKKITLENIVDMVSRENGIERVRIGSIYPDKISRELIELIKTRANVMPHLHLSLQAGSDKILKAMGRNYSSADVKSVVEKIRENIPEIEFTCDIITGFPGEGEVEFQEGVELIKQINFSGMHIFQYSDRENTKASMFKNKVEPKIKKLRAEILEKEAERAGNEIRAGYVGKIMKVLIEEEQNGVHYGYSENYLRVKVENVKAKIGEIIEVYINKSEKGMLIGEKKSI